MNGLDEVGAGEGRDRRRGGVENGDADQRVTGRGACVANSRHGEEADDDVRQTGGTDHQREGNEEQVDSRTHTGGVLTEAKVFLQAVENVEQVLALHRSVAENLGAVGIDRRAVAELREDVAGSYNFV